MDAAVRRGHLPLTRFPHEELGVGFGTNTLAEAAHGGCEPVLEWLVGAGCGAGTGYAYVQAAIHGDLATLRCLHRLGVPLGDQVWWRKLDGKLFSLAAVRWLVGRGAPWDEEGAAGSSRVRDAASRLVTKRRCCGWKPAWLSAPQRCRWVWGHEVYGGVVCGTLCTATLCMTAYVRQRVVGTAPCVLAALVEGALQQCGLHKGGTAMVYLAWSVRRSGSTWLGLGARVV